MFLAILFGCNFSQHSIYLDILMKVTLYQSKEKKSFSHSKGIFRFLVSEKNRLLKTTSYSFLFFNSSPDMKICVVLPIIWG